MVRGINESTYIPTDTSRATDIAAGLNPTHHPLCRSLTLGWIAPWSGPRVIASSL